MFVSDIRNMHMHLVMLTTIYVGVFAAAREGEDGRERDVQRQESAERTARARGEVKRIGIFRDAIRRKFVLRKTKHVLLISHYSSLSLVVYKTAPR